METSTTNRSPIEQIETLIADGRWDTLDDLLDAMHPADIAELLDDLSSDAGVALFEHLNIFVASEVLDETGSRVRQDIVDQVDEERLADLLDELPMDDAAEFLEDLPDQTADRLLNLMEPEEAREVRDLLSYAEETAGRLMTRDVAVLRRQWSVADTFNYLRSLEDIETLHYLYVVDRDTRLLGVVPLRRLVLAQPEQTVESLLIRDIFSVPVTADQEALAEAVSKYDYFAIPVVDELNRFVGVVTVDDVLDVIADEVTEDIQRLAGSEPLDQPYFALTTVQLVRKRLIWLLLLFTTSILTDTVIRNFDTLLITIASLTIFIPAVSGTGGNAGSQAGATVIRALALGEIRSGDLGRALRREIAAGVIMGLILGLFGFARAAIFNVEPGVALVLAMTLPIVIAWANTVASVIPLLADRLHIDPTVVSGPLIATFVDATGLLIYFSIAVWLLT